MSTISDYLSIDAFTTAKQKAQQILFTRTQQQAFLEDFGSLIEDGVPARQALETVNQVEQGIPKEVANHILLKIAEGQQLADGMYGWFPQATVEMVRAGEEGGTLADTIKTAAHALEQQSSVMSAFLGATLYPFIVICLGMTVMVFVNNSVFKDFAMIKPVAKWPVEGRNFVQAATFIQHWWWLVAIALVVVTFIVVRLLRSLTGDSRKVLDKMPLVSLYRDVAAARFMEILGMLMTNGIVFKKALSIMQYRATPYIAWHMFVMEFRLSGGRENIGEVVDTGLIKRADILRLQVIAQGRGFEHALVRLGRRASERNTKTIKLLGRLFGGIMLAFGALIIAFIIFNIYLVGSSVAL